MGTKDIDKILNDLDSFLDDSPSIPSQNLEEIVEHYIKDQKTERSRTVLNMFIILFASAIALINPIDVYHGVLNTIIVITIIYFYYTHLRSKKKLRLQDKTVPLEEFSKHRREVNLSVIKDFKFFKKMFYPQMVINIILSFITFNEHYGAAFSVLEILLKVAAAIFVYRNIESTIKKYTKLAEN
jgi:hypothetical protein